MTLAEFKKLTEGTTERHASPIEWDEIKPHADDVPVPAGYVGVVAGVLISVDADALAVWEQARRDDAARELKRRADIVAAEAANVAARQAAEKARFDAAVAAAVAAAKSTDNGAE
mgnify:CR=1 FL=1